MLVTINPPQLLCPVHDISVRGEAARTMVTVSFLDRTAANGEVKEGVVLGFPKALLDAGNTKGGGGAYQQATEEVSGLCHRVCVCVSSYTLLHLRFCIPGTRHGLHNASPPLPALPWSKTKAPCQQKQSNRGSHLCVCIHVHMNAFLLKKEPGRLCFPLKASLSFRRGSTVLQNRWMINAYLTG